MTCPLCGDRLLIDGATALCRGATCPFLGALVNGRVVSLREAAERVGTLKAGRYDKLPMPRRPACIVKTCRKRAEENRLCFAHLALWKHAGSPPDLERWAAFGRRGMQTLEVTHGS